MAFDGLTKQQTEFIKKYLVKVGVFNRKRDKAYNEQLITEYKALVERIRDLEVKVSKVDNSVLKRAAEARLATAENIVGRNKDRPDTVGAHAELDEVDGMLTFNRRAILFKERKDALAPKLANAKKLLPQQSDALTRLWDEAERLSDTATIRTDEAMMQLALRRLTAIEQLIRDGVAERKVVEQMISDPTGGDQVLATLTLTAAKATLDVEVTNYKTVVDRLSDTFKPNLPPSLTTITTAIDGIISNVDKNKPEALNQAALQVKAKVAELEEAAKTPLADRQKWLDDLAAVNARMKTLNNHSLATDATRIAPKIGTIQGDITIASAKAANHQYKQACTDIDGLVDACTEVIKLADALKKILAIQEDRQQRVDELTSLSASPHATVTTSINEANAKLLEAQTALRQNPADIMTASKALDDIAPMIEGAKRLHMLAEKAGIYVAALKQEHTNFSNWQTGLNPADTPLDPDLGKFNQEIQQAEALKAVTNENAAQRGQALERCMAICVSSWSFHKSAMDARKKNALAYYEARTKHGTRLAKFEGKPGEEAVQEFIARMKTDARQAEGAAGRNDYHVGTQILDSSDKDEEAMLKQLEFGAAFFPKYKEVETLLNAINGKEDTENPESSIKPDPNQDKAAALISETQKLRADAYSKGVAQRDWSTANSLIDAAKARVEEAKKMLAAIKSIDTEQAKLGDKPDVAKATEVLRQIRETAGTYADGAFAKKLKLADDAIALATADKADTNTVSTNSATAITHCQEVIALAGKKKAYDAAHQKATQKYEADVKPKKTPENAIDKQCKKIVDLLKDAAKLAKAETYDFDGATAKVNEALSLANSVPAMLKQKEDLKTKIQKVTDQITKMKGPDYLAGCGKEIEQLEKVKKDYDEAAKAYDIGKMKTIAERGEALVGPLDKVAERYKDFKTKDYERWAKKAYDDAKDLAPDLADEEFKERKRVHDFYSSFRHEVARHSYAAAIQSYSPLAWASDTAKLVAGKWDAYKPVKLATRGQLDTAKDEADPADKHAAKSLKELEDRFAAAVGWEKQRFDYAKAKTLMEAIQTDTNTATANMRHFKDYKKILDDLDKEIAKLEAINKDGAVAPVLGRIKNKKENAAAMADAGQTVQGAVLLKAAIDEVQVALLDGGVINQFSEETAKMGSDAAKEGADLAALCDKASKQVSEVVKAMDGVALMPRALELGDRAAEAKASLPGAAATVKTELADIATALVALRQEIGHYGQILREIKAAEDLVAPLISGHAQAAYSAAEAQGLQDRLAGARHQLRSDASKKDEAMQTLEDVLRAYHPLKAAADSHVDYVDLRDQVGPLIEQMEKHDQRYAIQDEMVEFRTKMTEAEDKAKLKDHAAAVKLVNEAKAIHAKSMLKAKMAGNGKPTEDEIRDILNTPGGDKELDKIVESLDENATREVLRVAMTVRFGCTLEMIKKEAQTDDVGNVTSPLEMDTDADNTGKAKKGPNIKALYNAMKLLPSADTLSNESLLGVVRVAEGGGASDHHPGTKKMTMREGEMANSMAYGIGLEFQLEGVPDELKPKPGKEVRAFNWNTLHEVGHAVDDKLNFTTRRGKELGGWDYQSKDVGPYSQVIAKKFKYDKDYVARLMLKDSDPPVPENPNPDKITPDEWERRRITVKSWLENTYSTRSPWQTTSSAKACEIDGRCYHESMPGYWVSYPIAERSKGVTGYQFRSPLEWFSELYAAFHTDRLADAHPARKWLEQLKNPEEV